MVPDTNIFAREGKDGRHYLVYSMKVASDEPLAMILPIPTPKSAAEDAVTFINLEKYPNFFDEMQAGVPVKQSRNSLSGAAQNRAEPELKVVEGRRFIASFS